MLTALLLTAIPAFAGPCDAQLGKLPGLAADAAPEAYRLLARCDKGIAEGNFYRYVERATDADALVALAEAAIEADTWLPLWNALTKITSYEARDEVAQRIGAACASNPKVTTFLQGAYVAPVRDIEFQQWDDAYAGCDDEALWTWMDAQVRNPPNKLFDEKYAKLVDIYVARKRVDALPALQAGAIEAAAGEGPFDALLMKMSEAVAPELGSAVGAEDQAKLEAALVAVAKASPLDRAKSVAGQLANSGAEAAAAELLPTIYADRMLSGGAFLYGGAVIESGECKNGKEVVIHFATVTEPGRRWSIIRDLEAPLRGSKAKLKGCEVESPWPVLHTPEPVKSANEAEAWAKGLEKEWAEKGYSVKLQKEKAITLP